MDESIKLTGKVHIELIRNGEVVDVRDFKNLITTVGKAHVAGQINGVTVVPVTYLAVGTGASGPAAADTMLGAEIVDSGLERASATASRSTSVTTNDTANLVYTWTASGAKAVTEIGAFSANVAGVLLGRQVFSAINVVSTDQLQITYKFTIA